MYRMLLLLLLCSAGRLEAQRLAPELPRIPEVSFHADRFHLDEDRQAKAPDYRYEGMGIGAGIGLAVGIVGGFVICGQTDVSCSGVVPLTGLAGAAILGFTGLLIGGAFDKPGTEPEPAPTDSLQS
jgi:hypothetical protein